MMEGIFINYDKCIPRLKKLHIDTYTNNQIFNKEEIERLTNDILLDIDLPSNITVELGSLEVIEDQDKYSKMNLLPKNIVFTALEVTDPLEITDINSYREQNRDLNPEGIESEDTTRNGIFLTIFFYEKAFYRQTCKFYEKVPLSDEELKFNLMTAHLEFTKHNSEMLTFIKSFVVFMIVIIILTLILNFISLVSI